MGEDDINAVYAATYMGNNWVVLSDYIKPNIVIYEGNRPPMWKLNGTKTITGKLRLPRTRKKFAKFVMANGGSRKDANKMIEMIRDLDWSYYEAAVFIALGIDTHKYNFPTSKGE